MLAGLLKKYQGCDVYRCLDLGEEVLRIRRAADRMDVKIKQLEAENAEQSRRLDKYNEISRNLMNAVLGVVQDLSTGSEISSDRHKQLVAASYYYEKHYDFLRGITQSIGVDNEIQKEANSN